MAFTTTQGSGSAPDSFVGTSGVDAIAIANSDGNFYLQADAANDIVTSIDSGSALYGGVLTSGSAKGGAGDDTITITGTGNGTAFIADFVNGNADDDTLTIANGAGDTINVSTVLGGQGDDTMIVGLNGAAQSLFVNGNKGADTITSGGASTTLNGGQGNDTITVFAAGNASISGNNDNDSIVLAGNIGIDDATFFGGDGNDTISVVLRTTGTDDIFLQGNAGNDTLTGTAAGATGATSLFGGAGTDNITSNVAGTSTVAGGDGTDTIANSGTTVDLYTSATQGGAFAGATSSAAIGTGGFDTVTGFAVATDAIGFESATALTGTGATVTVTTDGAGPWDLNTNGVAVITDSASAFTTATTYAQVMAEINLQSFTGGVVGTAGDVGYISIERTASTSHDLFAIQLGSTRATGAATILNNSDSIAYVGNFTTDADFTAANVQFF